MGLPLTVRPPPFDIATLVTVPLGSSPEGTHVQAYVLVPVFAQINKSPTFAD